MSEMFREFAETRWERAKKRRKWFNEPAKDAVAGVVTFIVSLAGFSVADLSLAEVVVSALVGLFVAFLLPVAETWFHYYRLPRIELEEALEEQKAQVQRLKGEGWPLTKAVPLPERRQPVLPRIAVEDVEPSHAVNKPADQIPAKPKIKCSVDAGKSVKLTIENQGAPFVLKAAGKLVSTKSPKLHNTPINHPGWYEYKPRRVDGRGESSFTVAGVGEMFQWYYPIAVYAEFMNAIQTWTVNYSFDFVVEFKLQTLSKFSGADILRSEPLKVSVQVHFDHDEARFSAYVVEPVDSVAASLSPPRDPVDPLKLEGAAVTVPTAKEWGTRIANFQNFERDHPDLKLYATGQANQAGQTKWNYVFNQEYVDWFETHAGVAGSLARRARYVPDKFTPEPGSDNVQYWLCVVGSRMKHLSDVKVSPGVIIEDVMAKSVLTCEQFRTEAIDIGSAVGVMPPLDAVPQAKTLEQDNQVALVVVPGVAESRERLAWAKRSAERHVVDQAVADLVAAEAIEKPTAAAWCECDGESAYLCVRNYGTGALFYATIRVSGLVFGLTGHEFVTWTHTKDTKTIIPSGVIFKARLAELEWNGDFARWRLSATNGHGQEVSAKAHYASCATSTPVTRAPTLNVTGLVMAEPDLPGGPIPFAINLHAFGCADHGSPNERSED